MNDDIKISVVIPVYNSEKYIEKTLDTVCRQTVLPYEVIIINDGSKDKTVDVIQKYIEDNAIPEQLINVYSQKNAGAGEARNTGITKARGNWIAFLDSDDSWDNEKIELVKEAIVKQPDCIIITHDELFVYSSGKSPNKVNKLHQYYDFKKNFFTQLYKGNFLSTTCMVIKKEAFDRAGRFDTTLQPAEDYDMWLKLSKCGTLFFIEKPLASYLVRDDSISSDILRRYNAEMRICREHYLYLKSIVGEKDAVKIAHNRIVMIHKVEAYLALKSHNISLMVKIIGQLLPEYIKKTV